MHDLIGYFTHGAGENVVVRNTWSKGQSLNVICSEWFVTFILNVEPDRGAHPVNGFSKEKLCYASAILFVWMRYDQFTIDEFKFP